METVYLTETDYGRLVSLASAEQVRRETLVGTPGGQYYYNLARKLSALKAGTVEATRRMERSSGSV